MTRHVPMSAVVRSLIPLLLCFIFAANSRSQSSAPQTSSSVPAQAGSVKVEPPLAPTDHEQIIAYWTSETGWKSELQLRNNIVGHDLTVTPVLRLPDGAETPLAAVTIKPQEVKSVDLDAAISAANAPQLVATWGSLVLRYHSVDYRNLYAALMIRNVGHPFAFHIDASGETGEYQAGGREGVWWLPTDTANDYLIVTNQGDNTVPTTLSLYDASGRETMQKVLLGPHETTRYSVRRLLQTAQLTGSYGGIKISAPSRAGSIDTLHFIYDESAAFSAILKMFDYYPNAKLSERDFAGTGIWTLRAPMLALSNPDPALAFPPGTTLDPQLFIRNTTSKAVDVAMRFAWRMASTTGKSLGPQLHLLPYETRRVNVAALQDGTILPKQANWTSVTLTTNALPNEIMAVAASYDATMRYGAQTPFSDQLTFQWEGGMWEHDAYHNSIITAGNGGTKPTQAAFTIFYNQGTQRYDLEQTLQPDEQMWIDVGKLIREHIADKGGKTLPADLSMGSYEFRDLTHTGVGTLFEGKVIYDKTYGHVAYGCAACCGYGLVNVFYDPLGIPFLGTAPTGVNALNSCWNTLDDVSGAFYGNWSTANTSIATVDYYATHTGQGLGSTTSSTSGYLQKPTTRAPCLNAYKSASGGDNVTPKILLGGQNGTNITNTTQSVVVGQQIVLYAAYNLPSGVTVNSQSWSVPGTTVGGFNGSSTSGGPTATNFSQQSNTFYWVVPATSQQVSFTLNLSNGTSPKATATFNIAGPTAAKIATQTGQVVINPGPYLAFGNAPPNIGITFTASATPPSGYSNSFVWAQLITANTVAITATPSVTCVQITNPQNANGTGLDTQYPYATGSSTNDNPDFPLQTSYGTQVTNVTEVNDNPFNATMYLLWSPGLTNSIPVPLGYVSWQWSGDATYNSSTQAWSLKSGSGSANAFVSSNSYPTWSSNVPFSGVTCH